MPNLLLRVCSPKLMSTYPRKHSVLGLKPVNHEQLSIDSCLRYKSDTLFPYYYKCNNLHLYFNFQTRYETSRPYHQTNNGLACLVTSYAFLSSIMEIDYIKNIHLLESNREEHINTGFGVQFNPPSLF